MSLRRGRVFVLWESSEGIIERILIHGFTALIPVDNDMSRSIHFSENGISIRREDKSVIKCREGQDVTWTKRQIAAMSNVDIMKRTWRTFHTETPWTDDIPTTSEELHKVFCKLRTHLWLVNDILPAERYLDPYRWRSHFQNYDNIISRTLLKANDSGLL